MKRWFLVILIIISVIILVNCMSGQGKYYYQLNLIENQVGENKKELSLRGDEKKIIFVEAVEVDEIYNDYRMVYRTSPYQLNYYGYHFGSKNPKSLSGIFFANSLSGVIVSVK